MKKLLILAFLASLAAPCQAQDVKPVVPPNVVKFRQHLERLRLDVCKEELGMVSVVQNEFTKEDTQYVNKHTTQEEAQGVGNSSADLLESLTKTIVDLGGSDTLTQDELDELKRSLMESSLPDSIPLFDQYKI